MKNKKVMYLIASNYHGIGGHYYSVRTTAEALQEIIDPIIVVIGKTKSPVIELAKVPHINVYSNGWNIFMVIKNLIKIIREEKPDILHGFDWGVLFYARILGFIFKIPHINTLPGGGNPTAYYPYTKNLILYSQENFDYFKSHNKFKTTNLYLIPNRITALTKDQNRITMIKEKLDNSKKTFLRISRFALHYKESLKQAINLVEFLNKKGFKTQLLLIGTIAEKDTYNEIIEYIKIKKEANVYVFTEHLFTVNASELIDLADFVIGTGRGFMEASSRAKIMLTPIMGSEYPVLINEENFMGYFNTNFSPRNKLTIDDAEYNLANIISLLKKKEANMKAKEFSKAMFDKYFDINKKKDEYRQLYLSLEYEKKIYFFEFIEHFLRQFRSSIR